jgi:predicted O-methyltransferase YrrM
MNIVSEYLKYLWLAKGRHGTHSPFVYDFVDNCLRLEIPKSVKSDFRHYFYSLKGSSEVLEIKDLGAGSKRLSNQRKVSAIAKVSGSYGKYANLLYRISNHYQPKQVLELGTSMGLGTFMLAKGNTDARIETVEGCPQTHQFTKKKLEHLHNVRFINASFEAYLLQYSGPAFDLVFLDGDHRGESVLKLLMLLEPIIHDETIIIIDDIRWSDDMLSMWQQLIDRSSYHLTIDLFRMGIIARRPHQNKEHFIIRL